MQPGICTEIGALVMESPQSGGGSMRRWVTALAGIGLCLGMGQGMRAEDRPSVDAILLRLQQKNG